MGMPRTRAFERIRPLVLTSIFLSVSVPSVSGAQEAPLPGRSVPGSTAAKPGTSTTSGDQKMKLNEVEIHGELEKPKIFFILPKAKRDADSKQRQFRFYPDILEPLDKDRFEEEARVLYQHGIPAE